MLRASCGLGSRSINTAANDQARNDTWNLLSIFTKDGGLSTPWRGIYVSRDCSYFKVMSNFGRLVGLIGTGVGG